MLLEQIEEKKKRIETKVIRGVVCFNYISNENERFKERIVVVRETPYHENLWFGKLYNNDERDSELFTLFEKDFNEIEVGKKKWGLLDLEEIELELYKDTDYWGEKPLSVRKKQNKDWVELYKNISNTDENHLNRLKTEIEELVELNKNTSKYYKDIEDVLHKHKYILIVINKKLNEVVTIKNMDGVVNDMYLGGIPFIELLENEVGKLAIPVDNMRGLGYRESGIFEAGDFLLYLSQVSNRYKECSCGRGRILTIKEREALKKDCNTEPWSRIGCNDDNLRFCSACILDYLFKYNKH